MFKGIMPGKRVASISLATDLKGDQGDGKENRPEGLDAANTCGPAKGVKKTQDGEKKRGSRMSPTALQVKETDMESAMMKQAFDKLLDDLQIPLTLRPKLDTMDVSVKAAMLRSSQTLSLTPPLAPTSPPLPPPHTPVLRRTRSSNSLSSPRPAAAVAVAAPPALAYEFPQPPLASARDLRGALTPPLAPFADASASASAQQRSFGRHFRGASADIPRNVSQSHLPPVAGYSKSELAAGAGKSLKDKVAAKDISPAKICGVLANTSSTQLDVDTVKKLRLLLRNESASWTESFFREGGYAALLTRLNEILELEWREEQHDDQLLHELLRCFKALSTSSIGCFALRSSCPIPFAQLVSLLYSDKKPGDLSTRQLIVDLLHILFELYPSSSLPAVGEKPRPPRRREVWEDDDADMRKGETLITLPAPHKTFYSLIRALLLIPAPPPSEAPATPIEPHAFIESLHVPRIFKTYLLELSDVCRDYFWVFCHPTNPIWNLDDTDEGRVEKPRAPGGMTGGVEFEAMGYLTTHFKLINAVAKSAAELDLPKEHEHSAHRLHADLFASGIERVLLVSRKASTAYYPTLHLEIARYVSLAGRAKYELPWTLSRLIGAPPAAMCKPGRGGTPTKRAGKSVVSSAATAIPGGAPRLPTPQKPEAIRF